MKKKIICVISAIVFILTGILLIYRGHSQAEPLEVVTMMMDWDDIKETFKEAYEAADTVICGKVVSKETYENYHVIFTDVEVLVDETVKGDTVPKAVHIVYTGGIVDNIEYKCEEELIPNIGEQYLFLLNKGDDLKYYPVGGFQGTYKLYSKKRSSDKTITSFNPDNQLEKEVVNKSISQILPD